MSTELGGGYITVLPKMSSNFASSVNKNFVSLGSTSSSSFSSSFAKGLDKVGGVVSKITAVGAAAAGAAAVAFGGLTKKAVEAFSEYEQLRGGVETLFKSSSDTMLAYADKAFQTAGLSANQYLNTAISFSASLLQGLGGDTEKAANIANMAIVDMSDNVNKMGTDMTMVQNAYRGFAKQNFVMLDNLSLGYGGTREEMKRLLADAEKLSGIKYDISSFSDIAEAIHVIQVNMGMSGYTVDELNAKLADMSLTQEELTKVAESLGITSEEAYARMARGELNAKDASVLLGTTAKEAATTIEGSLKAMKGAWANLLEGMADDSKNFDVLLDNFVGTVDVFADNVMPRIEMALDSISKLIDKLAPKIAERLPGLIDRVVPSLVNAAIKIVGALVSSLPSIIGAVWDGVTKDVNTGFAVISALLLSKSSSIFKILGNMISGNGVSGLLVSSIRAVGAKVSNEIRFQIEKRAVSSMSDLDIVYRNYRKGIYKNLQPISSDVSKVANSVESSGSKIKKGSDKISTAGTSVKSAGGKFTEGFQKMIGSAAVIASVGVAIAGAGAGFWLMADGCAKIAEAGPLAAGALAIMGGVLLGFSAIVLTLGKSLSVANAPGILALGGALLLAGAGMAALGAGAALVASQGMAGIAALAIMSATLIILVPLLAIFGPVLDIASVGLLAFGAAILMAGVGIGVAAAGVSLLVMSFVQLAGVMPMIAEYGLMTAVSLTAIAGAMALCGISAVACGAGFVALGAMIIMPVASIGILMAEMLLLDAEMLISVGLLTALAGGFILASAGAFALASIIASIRSDCESAVASMWELQGSVDTVGNSIGWLQGTIDSFIGGAIGLFASLAGSGGASFEELWARITNATNSGVNNVIFNCQNMVNSTNNIFNSAGDSAYWAGVRLGELYASGLWSQEWNVRNAASVLANAAVAGLQNSSHISITSLHGAPNNGPYEMLPSNGPLASNESNSYGNAQSYGSVNRKIDVLDLLGINTNAKKEKEPVPVVNNWNISFGDTPGTPDGIVKKLRRATTYGTFGLARTNG